MLFLVGLSSFLIGVVTVFLFEIMVLASLSKRWIDVDELD